MLILYMQDVLPEHNSSVPKGKSVHGKLYTQIAHVSIFLTDQPIQPTVPSSQQPVSSNSGILTQSE